MNAMPDAKPCGSCGRNPQMFSETPEGRLQPVWRMACECGQGSLQWSVTPEAAVRLWNRTTGWQKENRIQKPIQKDDTQNNLD